MTTTWLYYMFRSNYNGKIENLMKKMCCLRVLHFSQKKIHFYDRDKNLLTNCILHIPGSSTSWRRTEGMREPVSEFHGGPYTTLTTAPRQTCGSTEHTVETCITMGSRRWHSAASLRETSSPASWTWRPEPSHLARMERSDVKLNITL